jgi:pyridoxamine 5'-phosphate oxidase
MNNVGDLLNMVRERRLNMNRDEVLQFLNSHPVCHLATTEGNQPHVRGMMICKVDKEGILFQTADSKDLWNQIKSNPKVEICFNDFQTGLQVRVAGLAEDVEDQRLKEEIVGKRSFLKPWVEERGYQMIKLFRVRTGRVFVWTREKNFDPKDYIDIG